MSSFVDNFADIVDPLRQSLRSKGKYVWEKEQSAAFKLLKEVLKSDTVMAYWSPTAETRLTVDASPFSVGAILEQQQMDGRYKVIEYASRTLTDVERRYSQTEKEGLAIVWSCERFHRYLIGTEFELYTDHQPLIHIYSPKSKPSARLERWVLRLQPFKFRIKYKSGAQNPSDALSRIVLEDKITKTRCETEEYVNSVIKNAIPAALTLEEIEIATREDETLQSVKTLIQQG